MTVFIALGLACGIWGFILGVLATKKIHEVEKELKEYKEKLQDM